MRKQTSYIHNIWNWKKDYRKFIQLVNQCKKGHGQAFNEKKNNLKPSRLLQIKSVWEAKIKHIISKVGQKRDHCCDRKEHEHMFTFPFTTVDNSLHSLCTNLKDFSNHLQDDDIHDAVYSQNKFAPSIIIDANSVKSVSPGCDMDNDMMDFGLSW